MVFEAYFLGIPVISVKRGGISEVIPEEHMVSDYQNLDEWDIKLKEMLANLPENSMKVKGLMAGYSAIAELEKVRQAVDTTIDNLPIRIWRREDGWQQFYDEFTLRGEAT